MDGALPITTMDTMAVMTMADAVDTVGIMRAVDTFHSIASIGHSSGNNGSHDLNDIRNHGHNDTIRVMRRLLRQQPLRNSGTVGGG